MTRPFVPPHPPRGRGPVPGWFGLFGERGRNAVYGWSEKAFRERHMIRKVFGYTVHIPLDPDAVQHVLLDNSTNYAKPDIVKGLLAPVIGRGLLTSDGKLWREQRRIVAASFVPPAVDALVPAFGRTAGRIAEAWQPGTLDMAAQATATTMRVIADTLFAGDPRLTSRESMDHITAALEGFSEARLQALLGLPVMPWSRKGKAAHRGQIFLRSTLEAVVRERLAGGGPDDFLGRMIASLEQRFESAEAAALAADNAATFYLAGHETTANALTWTLFLLSEQLDLQDSAAAEAREALSGGCDEGIAERLPLLRRILEESLRLYPPVPRFDRQALADDRLGEREVAAGSIVSIWPWLLHRHQALWEEPDRFDPDRFHEERRQGRHRFQFIPFGGGPRLCVGMRFAITEALTVLARWLAEWRFEPTPGREVRPSGLVTLRPAGGLPLILSRRS